MELIPDPLHALLLVFPFAVTALVVNQVLWKPLLAFLDERDAQSHHALREAEKATHDAAEGTARVESRLHEARNAVHTARADARARAHARETEIVAEARRQADERVGQAVRQVQQDRGTASEALHTAARDLSADIAARVLGRNVA
jgi:F-type H+-transporting ATPase subunit b